MKKSSVLLAGALPLALILAGCAQIEETVGNVTGNHSYSKNLTVDGKVDTADGSYSSVTASGDYMNRAVNEGLTNGEGMIVIDNPDTGEKLMVQAQILRNRTVTYFFNEFIDSTALEGGAPALASWKSEKVAAGEFDTAPFTKEWLDGVHGQSIPVLSADFLGKDGGLKFIHDGKPRMTDASITFGAMSWTRNNDGAVIKMASDWSVDYRVTDQTVIDVLKAQNKFSDEDVAKYLTDDVKDGSGENTLTVSGKADWFVLDNPGGGTPGTTPIYLISAQLDRTFGPFIKPEFRTAAPTAPAAP